MPVVTSCHRHRRTDADLFDVPSSPSEHNNVSCNHGGRSDPALLLLPLPRRPAQQARRQADPMGGELCSEFNN